MDGARVAGRLGLMLYDSSDPGIVALTAAQVTFKSTSICHDGALVATSSADNDRSDDRHRPSRPAATMIEKVVLDETARVAPTPVTLIAARKRGRFGLCADPRRFTGKSVLVHTRPGEPVKALLRSTYGLFRMPRPDGGETALFSDALTIESLDGKPVTNVGDAGAVVTTTAGDALGVIICGIGLTSFAAPIGPVLPRDGSLQPLSFEQIYRWNERAAQLRAAPPDSEVVDIELSAEVPLPASVRKGATSNNEPEIQRASAFIQDNFFSQSLK